MITTGRIGLRYARLLFPDREVILVGSKIGAALDAAQGSIILCGLPALILRHINPQILEGTGFSTVEEYAARPEFLPVMLKTLAAFKEKRPVVHVVLVDRNGISYRGDSMKIVGVGCGPGMLTEEAILRIAEAKTIYGSDRAIEIARPHIRKECVVRTIDDFKSLHTLPQDVVVLSTGDPMLAGLGYLSGEVTPGVSSLQVAAARLHLPLSRISIIVAHGRGHEKGMQETLEEVQRGKIVYLLADPKFDVTELYRQLGALPGPIRIAVCENLGYPEERIATGDISLPPVPGTALYSLVIGHF